MVRGQDSQPLYTQSYDSQGRLHRITDHKTKEASSKDRLFRYDDSGRLSRIDLDQEKSMYQLYRYGNFPAPDTLSFYSNGIQRNRFIQYRNRQGKLMREEIQNPPGQLQSLHLKKWDTKGKLVEANSYQGDSLLVYQEKRSYNPAGKLTAISSYTLAAGRQLRGFTYNSQGLLVQDSLWDENQQLQRKNYYDYNAFGQCQTRMEINFHGTCTDTSLCLYQLNDQQLLASEWTPSYLEYSGNYSEIAKDRTGKTLQETSYEEGNLSSRQSYLYDQQGRLTGENWTAFFPGNSSGFSKQFIYAKDGKLSEIVLVDSASQVEIPDHFSSPSDNNTNPDPQRVQIQHFAANHWGGFVIRKRPHDNEDLFLFDFPGKVYRNGEDIPLGQNLTFLWEEDLHSPEEKQRGVTREKIRAISNSLFPRERVFIREQLRDVNGTITELRLLDHKGLLLHRIWLEKGEILEQERIMREIQVGDSVHTYAIESQYFEFLWSTQILDSKGKIQQEWDYSKGHFPAFSNLLPPGPSGLSHSGPIQTLYSHRPDGWLHKKEYYTPTASVGVRFYQWFLSGDGKSALMHSAGGSKRVYSYTFYE